MVDYINGSSKQAVYLDNEIRIILAEGDNSKEFRLVLNPINDNSLVVTAYRKSYVVTGR